MKQILSVCNKSDMSLLFELPALYFLQDCDIAKRDSVASKHYLKSERKHLFDSLEPYPGPSVKLQNDLCLAPSHQGQLLLSIESTSKAKKATTLLNLQISLVFIEQQ